MGNEQINKIKQKNEKKRKGRLARQHLAITHISLTARRCLYISLYRGHHGNNPPRLLGFKNMLIRSFLSPHYESPEMNIKMFK